MIATRRLVWVRWIRNLACLLRVIQYRTLRLSVLCGDLPMIEALVRMARLYFIRESDGDDG